MEHKFPVTVVDDKGTAVAGARVCVVEKSALGSEHHPYPSVGATHGDQGGGKYAENATITPTDGDWVLVVTLDGKSPVVQPFKLKKGTGDLLDVTAKPGAVATVTITKASRTVGTSKVQDIAFKVKLYPAQELVFIGGIDYHRQDPSTGWLFHEYGFNRAEVLRREKKINAGAIVTVFSTAKIWRKTTVWGGKKWVDVEVAQLGDPKSRVFAPKHETYVPVAGLDIHITDFYKYVAEVGRRAPGSVLELGIFSHSYPGGPILYNTGEGSAYKTPGSARDPDDFDARPKDWNDTNFADYEDMLLAFAPKCRFGVWGCSATTHFKNRSRKAIDAIEKKKGEDDFFTVDTEYTDDDGTVYSKEQEHTSEIRHRWWMDALFRSLTYPAEAAKRLKIEVRAGCPGTGSDPSKIDGIEMLSVDVKTYSRVYDYYHAKFAPEFAETKGKWDKGYVDYHALQGRKAVPKPGFSTEYYSIDIQTKVTRWQPTTGAQLTFWKNGVQVDHPTPHVEVVVKAAPGLATPGKKGHLFVLKDKDKTKSQAVYVQEDERIFMVTQDAKHEWTVIGAEL